MRSVGEPVEECVGGGDVAAHVQILKAGSVSVVEALPEPTQVVPDRVAVQDRALGRSVRAWTVR